MQQQPYKAELVQHYLPLLRGLSSNDKLILAEMLIKLARSPEPHKSIDEFFGAFISDQSAEEMIADIEGSRTYGATREPLD
jgi:hypothetical protein